jgi:uncharacterized protein YbjT (DUF2867 family)
MASARRRSRSVEGCRDAAAVLVGGGELEHEQQIRVLDHPQLVQLQVQLARGGVPQADGGGPEVRTSVRDPESPAAARLRDAGANLIEGDLDEPASVRVAMTGAYSVFMMLTPMSAVHITTEGIAAKTRWGTTVADLAGELSVAHLVYRSLRGAGQNAGVDYYAAKEAVEARIHETGIPATILRPAFFMDNLRAFNRPVLDDNGELDREPRGAQRHPGLARPDGRHRRVRGHRL